MESFKGLQTIKNLSIGTIFENVLDTGYMPLIILQVFSIYFAKDQKKPDKVLFFLFFFNKKKSLKLLITLKAIS